MVSTLLVGSFPYSQILNKPEKTCQDETFELIFAGASVMSKRVM